MEKLKGFEVRYFYNRSKNYVFAGENLITCTEKNTLYSTQAIKVLKEAGIAPEANYAVKRV